MKILLDGRSINRTGIGTYTKMLIFGLKEREDIHLKIIGDEKEINSSFRDLEVVRTSNSIYSLEEQISTLLAEIMSNDADIVHYTNYNKSLFSVKPYIITIHDLIQFKFEYGSKLKRKVAEALLKNAVINARAVICVSNSTKNDLLELIPNLDHSKVHLVYNSSTNPLAGKVEYVDVKSKYGLDEFLLCVGIRKKHKNLSLPVKALEILSSRFPKLKLVLVAKRFDKYDFLDETIESSKVKDRIIVLENIPYEEIVSLYRETIIVILPSFDEGFGLVPFEAISNDTLPLVSNIPVMRELFFEEEDIFFDPYSPENLADKLETFLNDSGKRESTLSRLKKYTNIYSFERFIDETVNVYRKVVNS
ncbi:MAG: glycosyltransferase family 1 protein [Spirochaetia bacterium]|nr:glycosyltransferase family 4 protein [Spirochaetota bacterium]MCX8096199.1 glycosyltransferase family 4 protein [Spirochaetota bacterium]MDW8111715.1 glycosyltransferase family 1 protein [Spirochaetia bacterium]